MHLNSYCFPSPISSWLAVGGMCLALCLELHGPRERDWLSMCSPSLWRSLCVWRKHL